MYFDPKTKLPWALVPMQHWMNFALSDRPHPERRVGVQQRDNAELAVEPPERDFESASLGWESNQRVDSSAPEAVLRAQEAMAGAKRAATEKAAAEQTAKEKAAAKKAAAERAAKEKAAAEKAAAEQAAKEKAAAEKAAAEKAAAEQAAKEKAAAEKAAAKEKAAAEKAAAEKAVKDKPATGKAKSAATKPANAAPGVTRRAATTSKVKKTVKKTGSATRSRRK